MGQLGYALVTLFCNPFQRALVSCPAPKQAVVSAHDRHTPQSLIPTESSFNVLILKRFLPNRLLLRTLLSRPPAIRQAGAFLRLSHCNHW